MRVSYIIVGLNHRTAPLEVREKLAFSREEAGEVARGLQALDGLEELAVLSTCNRTEVLAAPTEGLPADTAVREIRDFLGALRGLDPAQLDRHLYAHKDLDAVRHAFRVASSLDSMMVGEPQILGQVKEAYTVAVQAGSLGPKLEALLQRAFTVAKRVRTSTAISRNPVSISYAAADLAGRIFGSLAGRSVLILGAGKMADLAARHLIGGGVRTIYVASRTFQHAQEMARSYNAVPVTFDRFKEYLPQVDIVISSTAAPHYILRREDGLHLMKERRGAPIFFIDIAVPRDIDPELNKLDNLYLYDIDDLQKVVDTGVEERRKEAVRAEEIVEDEVIQFHTRARARLAAPTIVALREKLHGVAEEEMRRHRSSLGSLSENQETAVKELLASVVNKLLHGPTREVKRAGAAQGGASTVDLVRKMFDLPEDEAGDSGERKKAGG